MNFEQALLWMAIGAVVGFIIGYLLCMVIARQKVDKEKPKVDKGRKKTPAKKPVLPGEQLFANPYVPLYVPFLGLWPQPCGCGQDDNGQSRIEVINLSNCSFDTEPASHKREEKRSGRITPDDDFQNADRDRQPPKIPQR